MSTVSVEKIVDASPLGTSGNRVVSATGRLRTYRSVFELVALDVIFLMRWRGCVAHISRVRDRESQPRYVVTFVFGEDSVEDGELLDQLGMARAQTLFLKQLAQIAPAAVLGLHEVSFAVRANLVQRLCSPETTPARRAPARRQACDWPAPAAAVVGAPGGDQAPLSLFGTDFGQL